MKKNLRRICLMVLGLIAICKCIYATEAGTAEGIKIGFSGPIKFVFIGGALLLLFLILYLSYKIDKDEKEESEKSSGSKVANAKLTSKKGGRRTEEISDNEDVISDLSEDEEYMEDDEEDNLDQSDFETDNIATTNNYAAPEYIEDVDDNSLIQDIDGLDEEDDGSLIQDINGLDDVENEGGLIQDINGLDDSDDIDGNADLISDIDGLDDNDDDISLDQVEKYNKTSSILNEKMNEIKNNVNTFDDVDTVDEDDEEESNLLNDLDGLDDFDNGSSDLADAETDFDTSVLDDLDDFEDESSNLSGLSNNNMPSPKNRRFSNVDDGSTVGFRNKPRAGEEDIGFRNRVANYVDSNVGFKRKPATEDNFKSEDFLNQMEGNMKSTSKVKKVDSKKSEGKTSSTTTKKRKL